MMRTGDGRQSIRKPNRLYGISTVCHCVNNPIELIIDRKIQNSDYNYSIVQQKPDLPSQNKKYHHRQYIELLGMNVVQKRRFEIVKMASEAHADTETERECACLAYV